MSIASSPIRRVFSLTSIALLILASPERSESQPTLLLDFNVFGGAIEPNPGNPNQSLTVLFVDQPAILELTVTNVAEEAQTVTVGGGGGGGFTFESAALLPEGDGSCEVHESQTFFECTSVTVTGMGTGKNADHHNSRQVVIEVKIIEVSTGGFSFFVDNGTQGITTGGPADFRAITETRMLTVESLPPLVDIVVSPPGDKGQTGFTREYAAGTNIALKAPDEITTLVAPLFFFSWYLDSGGAFENNPIQVVMDADHTAFAEYGVSTLLGLTPVSGFSGGKRTGPVDIFADGVLVADDLQDNQVTPFTTVPLEATIDVTDGAAPDNSSPIMSFPFESDGRPALILLTEDSHFISHNARTEADDPTRTDVTLFAPLPAEIADAIRVVHRTSSTETEIFGPNSPLDENGFTSYAPLEPGFGVIEILDRADGTQLDAFQGELTEGGAVLGVLTHNGGRRGLGYTLLLFDAEGNSVETAVVTSTDDEGTAPSSFALHGNYPNPFNPETLIRFDVPERARVRVQVLNALGQVVETLVDGLRPPGNHSVVFKGGSLPSGSYFYRMTAGSFVETRRMVLLR